MLKGNQRSIVAVAIAGIFVSTYALYVEMAAEIRPGYKALCDISEHASCSRVLTSKWVYIWINIAVFRVNLRDNYTSRVIQNSSLCYCNKIQILSTLNITNWFITILQIL